MPPTLNWRLISLVYWEGSAERPAEVLPMLCTVVLHGPEETEPLLRSSIDARKLSDQPVVVS